MALSALQEAYCNFLALPPEERGFESKSHWARVMFPDDGAKEHSLLRRLNRWEKKPEFIEELQRRRDQLDAGGRYADYLRHQAALDFLYSTMKDSDASSTDKRQAANKILDKTQDAERPGSRITFTTRTEPELVAMMMGLHVSPRGIADEEYQSLCEEVAEWESQQASPQESPSDS